MTMPKARKINVQGKDFQYVLQGTKGREKGETGKTVRLVVEMEGKYVSMTFESLKWTEQHETDVITSLHKNSFTPADVSQVVSVLDFHKGQTPIEVTLQNWKLCSQKASKRGSAKSFKSA